MFSRVLIYASLHKLTHIYNNIHIYKIVIHDNTWIYPCKERAKILSHDKIIFYMLFRAFHDTCCIMSRISLNFRVWSKPYHYFHYNYKPLQLTDDIRRRTPLYNRRILTNQQITVQEVMDKRSCLNKNGLKRSGLKLMRNRINAKIWELKNGDEQ